jgi:hypothetical protein
MGLTAEAGEPDAVAAVARDQGCHCGAVTDLVVALENLRDRGAVHVPEAVDLALEVGHDRDARVDHADDYVRVARGVLERAVDVSREERPFVREVCHLVDPREIGIVRERQRGALAVDRRDVTDARIARRAGQQRVELRVVDLDQSRVECRDLVRAPDAEAVLDAERPQVLHRPQADDDLRAKVPVERARSRVPAIPMHLSRARPRLARP